MTKTEIPRRSDGTAVSVVDFKSKTSGFKTERQLVDFVERICTSSAARPWAVLTRATLNPARRFGGNKPKIDLMVVTTSGKRIGIECNFPVSGTYSELSRVMLQLLSYAVIAEDNDVPAHAALYSWPLGERMP
jgi:hypothetical protein